MLCKSMQRTNKMILSLSLAFATAIAGGAQQPKRLIDEVNPFIGTSNFGTTNPGAIVPNGLMSITIQRNGIGRTE